MSSAKQQHVDFLVLGSGIAGVRAAITLAAKGRVLILTKGRGFRSATGYAQGEITVARGEDNEVCLHRHDTLRAGDGLCREEAVRVLVEGSPRVIHELIEWATHFDRNGAKRALTREGAHRSSRLLRSQGDSTGAEIRRALAAKAKSLKTIRLQLCACAVDLVLDGGRVVGVVYFDEKTSTVREVYADAVLLSTGGLGQVYKETTNSARACGDGVAMAYRAGALVSDLEFIQFHPTTLYAKGAPRIPLSEALRAEGAQLRNIDLERFMPRYHEAAELAPRDVVARAMVMEMHRTASEFTYLDLTALDPGHIKKRFPGIYSTCLEYNLDITADLVPVRPAAHYAMGGVATDLDGATTLEGLFAAGEVAATGVHGANRLASNSLLEGLVFGARAARAMVAATRPSAHTEKKGQPTAARKKNSGLESARPDESNTEDERMACEVRCLLWNKLGIIRSGKGLKEAVARLDSLSTTGRANDRRHFEAQNILQVAKLIARSALAREESRGAHYRSDFPSKNDLAPARHSYVSRDRSVYFE